MAHSPLHMAEPRKALAPISLNTATATDTPVDCLGFDYATIEVSLGVVGGDATVFDIHFTPLSDTAVAAGNKIFGAAGDVATDPARLFQTADAGTIFTYHVNLGSALAASGAALPDGARYLQFVLTTGATTIPCITVWLSRGSPAGTIDGHYIN